MKDTPEAVLRFWFADALESAGAAEERCEIWFAANDDFDREIERRFGALPERARRGELDAWRNRDASGLALVIALDQFPRNLFRGSAKAFAFDAFACEVAKLCTDRRFDRTLHPLHASFLYLPFEHAEDVGLQELCVSHFQALEERAPASLRGRFEQFTAYAERHREVVRRFGRFPHRNAVLERESTPEESEYLTSGGETFG